MDKSQKTQQNQKTLREKGKENCSKKILLIDAFNLIFQAYYGSLKWKQESAEDQGRNLLCVFMLKIKSMLKFKHLNDVDYVCLVLDSPKRNARKKLYPGYKSQRVRKPDAILEQIENMKKIARLYGINQFEVSHAEADDSIGFLSTEFIKSFRNAIVYIYSTDNDYLQLMGPQVNIIKKIRNKISLYTIKHFYRDWEFKPENITDYKSICGDPSDNIPGVYGIGTVKARRLINRFKTIQNIFDNISELPEGDRTKFSASLDHINIFKKIVTINCNLNETIDFRNYEFPRYRKVDEYNEFCEKFEIYKMKITK